jgi:hypothetical protein
LAVRKEVKAVRARHSLKAGPYANRACFRGLSRIPYSVSNAWRIKSICFVILGISFLTCERGVLWG